MALQEPARGRVGLAVLGVGNLGRHLLGDLRDGTGRMELLLASDSDADCEGLRLARELAVEASSRGVDAVLERPDVEIVLDASTAGAHAQHARRLREAGKVSIDLTPAATGPFVVPHVNLAEHIAADDLNLLSCPAQVAIPLVHAVTRLAPALYAEVVSTVASASVGPGMRRYVDEFTSVTARGLEQLGGARHGKSILILSPADPPVTMRSTVYVVPDDELEEQVVDRAVRALVAEMQRSVPGYRLRGEPAVGERDTPWGRRCTVAVSLEVEGSGDRLSRCGNLDVTASAARAVGDEVAGRLLRSREVVV